MAVLHDFNLDKKLPEKGLNSEESFSVYYHDVFEYPLTFSELLKWTSKNKPNFTANIECKDGYFFIKGREGIIYKRTIRKRFSQRKMKIAKRATKIISLIPNVRMVGITGSLAMENAKKENDIDMIVVTKKGRLWTTRSLVYLLLKLFGFSLRKPQNSREEDKLCMNMWLDESDLVWSKSDRNAFSAHEILQIIPLFDVKGTYKRLLQKNIWALNYWPNAIEAKLSKNISPITKPRNLSIPELIAYKAQYWYMKSKITKEVVTPTRAIFHPNKLSKKIIEKIRLTGEW